MPKLRDIIGHSVIRRELQTDLFSGNLSHAYLFAGPRHLGKMTIARQFAFDLLSHGSSPAESERIRHDCERLTHPDLCVLDQLWIAETCEDWEKIAETSNAPQEEREKKGMKTDTIGVDDIRSLQGRLSETSIGTYRCCIIRSVERMNAEASNALLKILEEPPAALIFLFTTESLQSLLPTVVSRMRIFRFHPLGHADLHPLLEGVPDDDREFILHLAQGAPGIAHVLRSDPETLRMHRTLHMQAASFWRSRSLKERLQILAPLGERGEESDRLLLHLALALREHHASLSASQALHEFIAALQTNAHRGLLMQRFVLAITEETSP